MLVLSALPPPRPLGSRFRENDGVGAVEGPADNGGAFRYLAYSTLRVSLTTITLI